jgi:hypothetical protein
MLLMMLMLPLLVVFVDNDVVDDSNVAIHSVIVRVVAGLDVTSLVNCTIVAVFAV